MARLAKHGVIDGLWSKPEDIVNGACSFNAPPDALKGATVYFASYTYEYYSGDALVIFKKGGKFYEQHGSHCSCYGLEMSAWSPEEVTLEQLKHRLDNAREYGIFAARRDDIRKALGLK